MPAPMKMDFFDYLLANGLLSVGQQSFEPGGDNLSLSSYGVATGRYGVPKTDPSYRAWVQAQPAFQAMKADLSKPEYQGLNFATVDANGQANIPEGIQSQTMDGPQFMGFDRNELRDIFTVPGIAAGAAFAAGGLGAGAESGAAFNPAADYGASYFAGAEPYIGSGAGSLGVNPQAFDPAGDFGADYFNGAGDYAGFKMPAAVPETPQQLAEWGLKETSPGTWEMPNMPGSAGTAADWLKRISSDPATWGKLAATALGVVGASQQQAAQARLAREFAEYGAPYRARLAESYADPAGFLERSPDIRAAVDQGTNATARALSVQGNPAGSGHALQELQSYATNTLHGRLGAERDRLAGFGGLTAYNQAAPGAAVNATNAEAGVPNAIGAGINSITAPIKTTYQTMMDFFKQPGVA